VKIETLTIRNFRCFGSDGVTIPMQSDLTAFVGNNGSGKTAVFQALSRLFGITTSQRRVVKSDFHLGIADEEIASGSVLSIDCIFVFPDLAADEDDPSVPDVFYHMAASAEGAPLKLRVRLEASWVEDLTPEGTVTEEVKWVGALDDDYDWDECAKVAPMDRSLIQLLYVPASRNAFDQVTNLLKGRLWKAAHWSQALNDTAESSSAELQAEFDSEEPAEFIIERLAKRWTEVHQGDTDATPALRLVANRLEDLLQRAEFIFSPAHGPGVRRLDELSDGQRSLFHIALTAAALEIERDALAADPSESLFDHDRLKRTTLTILAIEEPENSLSPFFLTRIMAQGRDIGAMKEAQVIVSSHSSSILSRVEPEEVRYTRLDETTRQSTVRALTLPANGTEERKYVRLAVRSYPDLYFARFVVLAEGDSESIVLPRIADAKGKPLDRSFVPIVPLSGRFVTHFWRLLNDLDIPHATLIDLDLGRKHGGKAAIKRIVEELAAIGNDLSSNRSVVNGDIDLYEIDDIADADLLSQDQKHPWLKALRRERVFFSSPIDLDFAMLILFPDEYQQVREGGLGPRTSADAIASKKGTTLKTGGSPALYSTDYDPEFTWYPYLFLGESKPETHLRALSEIEPTRLAT
jgi:predicted ATPase